MKRLVLVILLFAGMAHAEPPEGTPATVIGHSPHAPLFPGPALLVETTVCSGGGGQGELLAQEDGSRESCYFLPDQTLEAVRRDVTREYRDVGYLLTRNMPLEDTGTFVQAWTRLIPEDLVLLVYEPHPDGLLLWVGDPALDGEGG